MTLLRSVECKIGLQMQISCLFTHDCVDELTIYMLRNPYSLELKGRHNFTLFKIASQGRLYGWLDFIKDNKREHLETFLIPAP